MNELKYLIFQALMSIDRSVPKREIVKSVKGFLDNERVGYDPEMIEVYIDVCLSELEKNRE